MAVMRYFDYESLAKEAGISDGDLETIKQAVREEFPNDDMMWELHVLRACSAINVWQTSSADGRRRWEMTSIG